MDQDEGLFGEPRVYDAEMPPLWDGDGMSMFDDALVNDDPTLTTNAMLDNFASPSVQSPSAALLSKHSAQGTSSLMDSSKGATFHTRSAVSSSSPDSSNQDSSSESSGKRKRTSSSMLSPVDMNFSAAEMNNRWGHTAEMLFRDSPILSTETDVDTIGRDMNHVNIFSARNSPGHSGFNTGDHTITPAKIEKSFQPKQHGTQISSRKSQFFIGADSRDNSPNMTISNGGSPAALNSSMSAHTPPSNNPTWQNDFIGVSPSTSNSVSSPPTSASDRPLSQRTVQFSARPLQTKSRVETQISVRLITCLLPSHITKLHLPRESISKTKNYAKEIVKSTDTLELHTSVVCASALIKPGVEQMALRRAARAACFPVKEEHQSRRSSSTNMPDDDPNDPAKPLNGGEVQICENCVARERKRAARKRVKKQEDEETWNKFERERIVVFNEKEYKEWQPPKPKEGSHEHLQYPEGALLIEVPMRIACYCRHQGEKQGFQVIFTLTDSDDQLVAQSITAPILITDDHKTHQAPQPLQTPDLNPGLYERQYHSTNDLQALRNGFQQHQPAFFTSGPGINPQGLPSGVTSATMTPRNGSRQASPSAQSGANKRRKGSGSHHHRLPNSLTMTPKINTQGQGISSSNFVTSGPPSATATTFASASSFMPQSEPAFMNPMGMGPAMENSPPTPGMHGVAAPGQRKQSGENLQHFFSVPNSARQSRSGSPVSATRAPMNAYQQQQHHQQHMNFVSGMNTTLAGPQNSMDAPQPTRHTHALRKILPSEGPVTGGIEVTCLGSGFTRNLEVKFGDHPATTTTWWSESTLVCLLPPAIMPGPVPVRIIAPNQQPQAAVSHIIFTYKDDSSNQLFQLALDVMSQRCGNMDNFKNFLIRMADSSNASMGPSYMGGPQQQSGYRQMQGAATSLASRQVTEDMLMRCLDILDLDENPEPPQYNMQTKTGATMVSLGCALGYTRFVMALLARGADPEIRDNGGFTPLMMASLYDQPQLVRRLILRGADPMIRSLKGYLAIDFTRSTEVQDALQRLPHHTRTRSAGAAVSRSRASSLNSMNSVWRTATPSSNSRESEADPFYETDDEEADDEDELSLNKSKSRGLHVVQPVPDQGFVASAAAAAAFGQIAASFQQLQQNVHWFPHFQLPALPPMPTLEGYQANPMVRRISSLVPHGTPARIDHSDDEKTVTSSAMLSVSNLRDLFSSSPQPPAYEEIYPEEAKAPLEDLKEESIYRAQAENVLDQKCGTLFDTRTTVAESSTTAAKPTIVEPVPTKLEVKIGRRALSKEEQQRVRSVHLQKKKPIYKDWHLWFIWIPLFILFLCRRSVLNGLTGMLENTSFFPQQATGRIFGEA